MSQRESYNTITKNSTTDCKHLIYTFLENELDLDISSISIERAHRLGTVGRAKDDGRVTQNRPIIVRFRDYPDTVDILKSANKLKGTTFGIDRDYPREIADARK